MSVRINDKVIAGTYTPQSYRYVGEIFQSILPINDVRVALLDGHKIYDSDGHGGFIQYLNSLVALYPQLACTEDEWQLSNTTYGECGKFVVNEDGSIRLPKIVSFIQGLSSLQDLATLVEAGLPNITGAFPTIQSTGVATRPTDVSGAFSASIVSSTPTSGATGDKYYNVKPYLNASLSNPIYGNSPTVQPQSIRYPYYIVLATGVSQELRVKQNLTTNNPFFLGMSQYFETAPNNLSWLKSEGQYNPKGTYPAYYDWALVNANNGVEGFKFVTDTYTDYDYVINTADETFRLPLLDGSEDLPSDKFDDLTLMASGTSYYAPANGWYMLYQDSTASGQYIWLQIQRNDTIIYDTSIYSTASGNGLRGQALVSRGDECIVTYTAPTKGRFRFIYAQGNGSLYFYVGETVQNANLVNVGRIQETYTTKSMVDGQWKYEYKILLQNRAFTAVENVIIDMNDYLPDDGYDYEVLVLVNCRTGTTLGNRLQIVCAGGSFESGHVVQLCQTETQVNGRVQYGSGSATIVVPANDRNIFFRQGVPSSMTVVGFAAFGYRRIGTNL